ncbi:MAG: Peptidase Ste24p precursor [Thermoleophilia bacterium]|nr:Peptidase Ste24p precursor [Thermoleophilia bacterium]
MAAGEGGGRGRSLAVRAIVGIVLAVGAAIFTYAQGEEQKTPITGRTQRVSMSDTQQAQLGLQVYDETLQTEAANVVASGPEYEQVQRVAQKIIAVAGKDKPDFDWQVTLLRSDQVNAYCLPGGKIVVYTGILPVTKSDAGLATVMGHEVAHATAEHGAERIFREELTKRAVTAASGAFADDPQRYQQVATLLGAGAQFGLQLPWGRSQESEADHIGLIYLARAGYEPAEAVAFWKRMQASSKGGEPPEYLSTHPSHGTRIAQITEWLPEARAEQD